MKKFFKNLKNSSIASLLSLIFANEVKAQSMPEPLDEVFWPTPGEMLVRLLPFITGVFLVFVAAPIAGLVWYRKHGGTKKWPKVVVRILAILFVIALAALIILLYSSLS